jgi:IS30 family transposase
MFTGGTCSAGSSTSTTASPRDRIRISDPRGFIGRRHGRRADRRWAKSWSPEQISHRLRIDFPDDASMRISHEAIYQALYVQGRGALRRELVTCLRTGRALRVLRARTRGRGRGFVTPEVLISERPAEVADQAVPGHWEGDLIVGVNGSAIGTLVERTTRFTLLLHLPPMDGHGSGARTKNGQATAGHGAEAVRDAIADAIGTLPEQLRRSLTWDQGAEMAQHAQLRIDTGVEIYFCDPHSPWQRGSNENTNGLLRQYFRRAPISPGTPELNSTPSRSRSTCGHARRWPGRHPPRRSATSYTRSDKPVLRRLLEPAQYLAIRYTERLADAEAVNSVGSKGDSYDNALAESVNALYKAELIHRRGPWRSVEQVELATAEWVDWWNRERLHGTCGRIPPAEFEAAYARLPEVPTAA